MTVAGSAKTGPHLRINGPRRAFVPSRESRGAERGNLEGFPLRNLISLAQLIERYAENEAKTHEAKMVLDALAAAQAR